MTLREIVKVLLYRMWIILLIPAILIALASYFSFTGQTPVYTAESSVYLLEADAAASTTQIAYVEKVTDNYKQLAETSHVRNAAAEALGLSSLEGISVTVTAKTADHRMTVTVTASDPATAANAANVYADCAIGYIRDKMSASNLSIIETATPPASPSGPNYTRPIITAGAIGLLLGVVLAFVIELGSSGAVKKGDAAAGRG